MKSLLTTTLGSLTVIALAGAVAGCSNEAYCFTCESAAVDAATDQQQEAHNDAPATDGAGGFYLDGSGGSTADAKEAGDAPFECQADVKTDPKNCGACGNLCEIPGAYPKCVAGACVIDTCVAGRHDNNGNPKDGCEYACTLANGGVEVCNGMDDNCDGKVDEGFDVKTDPSNCGFCGNLCALPHATAGCAEVSGIVRCVVASCENGYADIDNLASDGCEYGCPVVPSVAELCNDKDDDCDGVVNNGNPGGGQPCDTNCPGGVCVGECTSGSTTCIGADLQCVGGAAPALEVCDNKDNDCDGTVDNGYDLSIDPLNCGVCGLACTLDHAIGGCAAGTCVIDICLPGFANVDTVGANGCEYACPVWPTTVETCNGKDDDCNGTTDDSGALAAEKPSAVLCQPKVGTPCQGSDFACAGVNGWRCVYGPGVEVGANGKLAQVESLCDGIDGNCNGQVDESFQDNGTACDNGKIGACRDQGVKVCNQTKDGTQCDLTPLPDPVPGAPSQEVCNGVDDDCNGQVDDAIVDDMVQVTWATPAVWIDRFEASHPDATASQEGTMTARSCTKPGVLPWTHVTQTAAAAACATRGARLCTAAELQAACEGAATTTYPYGSSYQPLSCNGLDFDGVPGGANDDVVLPCGDALLSACVTTAGVHDMSGNVAEWSSTQTGTTGAPLNTPIYQVRGGSYGTPVAGLTCQFSLSRYAATAILADIGFRCCKD